MNENNYALIIRQIEDMISEIKAKHDAELRPYYDGIEALRVINTACEKCDGAGEVMRPRACAEDDRNREMIPCSACGGTGRKAKA